MIHVISAYVTLAREKEGMSLPSVGQESVILSQKGAGEFLNNASLPKLEIAKALQELSRRGRGSLVLKGFILVAIRQTQRTMGNRGGGTGSCVAPQP